MGTWALFLTIITVFENTKSALLKNAHIKFVTANIEGEQKAVIASSSLLINISINIIFIALILLTGKKIGVFFNSANDLYIILIWFIPGLISMVFFSHLEAVQLSHFDFKGVFAGNFLRQLCFFIFLVIHFLLKKPINMFLLGLYQSITIFLGAITLFIFSKKYLLMKFNPTVLWIKKILNYGGYIFGSGVVSNIYSNADQFMTAAIIPGSIAFYNAAKRINGFIDIPTYAAADIIFPKLSLASSEEGIKKVKYLYEKMVAVLLSLIIPVAILFILFPKLIIYIIAGDKYLASAPILQIYMLISVIGILQHQAATTLYSLGKTKLCFAISTLSLLINLIITFICLKLIGFYGAAVGSLITSLITFVTWYFIVKKEIGFNLSNIPVYSKEYYLLAYSKIKTLLQQKSVKNKA